MDKFYRFLLIQIGALLGRRIRKSWKSIKMARTERRGPGLRSSRC